MKKHLIAAAVAAAVAAPAMAQTVTLSGRIGATFDSFKNAPAGGGGATQQTVGDPNTRLIATISEDLGGGLRFVGQIDLRGGTDTGGTGDNTSGNTFASLVGGFGRILVGRHDMLYNETLGNSTSSDVLDGTNIHRRTLFTSNRTTNGSSAPTQITGTRVANLIRYDSPSFGDGFNLTLGYSTNPGGAELNSNTAASGGDDDGSATMAFLRYAQGPLRATLGHYSEKRDVASATKPKDTFTLLAASYVTGPFEIGFNYTDAEHNNGSGTSTDRSNFSIPLNYKSGNYTLHAGYTKVGKTGGVANTGAKQYMLGMTYNLSKRTLLGAGYSKLDNESAARYQMLGSVQADSSGGTLSAAGADGTYMGFGIRHNF